MYLILLAKLKKKKKKKKVKHATLEANNLNPPAYPNRDKDPLKAQWGMAHEES